MRDLNASVSVLLILSYAGQLSDEYELRRSKQSILKQDVAKKLAVSPGMFFLFI